MVIKTKRNKIKGDEVMNVRNHDQETNKVIMIKRNRKISKANE
jgi:hypothetical protein